MLMVRKVALCVASLVLLGSGYALGQGRPQSVGDETQHEADVRSTYEGMQRKSFGYAADSSAETSLLRESTQGEMSVFSSFVGDSQATRAMVDATLVSAHGGDRSISLAEAQLRLSAFQVLQNARIIELLKERQSPPKGK